MGLYRFGAVRNALTLETGHGMNREGHTINADMLTWLRRMVESMGNYDLEPLIVNLPYGDFGRDDFARAIERELLKKDYRDDKYSDVDMATVGEIDDMPRLLSYVVEYPTVYVVYSAEANVHSYKMEYMAYVGETNDIMRRTAQHLEIDSKKRDDWHDIAQAVAGDHDSIHQYVISHPHFNKSLTLDVENRLMHYLSSVESVKKLNNRRTNAQGAYYTSDQFDRIFSDIWLGLHHDDPVLFPAEEIIRDSALFKASPFHRLSDDQLDAEEMILAQLSEIMGGKFAVKKTSLDEGKPLPKLIFVMGAAGTGKTVLLSHLFYRVATEMGDGEDASQNDEAIWEGRKSPLSSYILVNHNEQLHVYNQIATKLGLQKHSGDIVMSPSQFINRFSETNAHGRGNPERPKGMADIVLIDEAHLLMTQGNQGYSGKNQLYDVLRRARIVIAVFDPRQILRSQQRWRPEVLDRLFPDGMLAQRSGMSTSHISHKVDGEFRKIELGAEEGLDPIEIDITHIHLGRQFRIAASEEVIQWIENFASGKALNPLPVDEGERDDHGDVVRAPYDVKVFDSPIELYESIQCKSELEAGGWNGVGLSRILATYDWPYSSKTKNDGDAHGYWNVSLRRDASGHWRKLSSQDKADAREISNGTDEHQRDWFSMPWNYQLPDPSPKSMNKDLAWAEKPYTIKEVGSIFTIQGFDLNYAGVIIGPSVKYRDGRIVFDKTESENSLATNRRSDLGDFAEDNLRNELNVLLTRGVHGLYLFAVDPALQERLKECCPHD